MAQFYKVQCALLNDSGLDENVAINTFHFLCSDTGGEADQRTDLVTAMSAFYHAVDDKLSANVLATDGLRIKIYDHEDAPPRLPKTDALATLTPAADFFPNEVAICISYRKTPTSGSNRARERGRIYFGPLSSAGTSDIVGDIEVGSALRTTLANAAFDLVSFVGAVSGSLFEWCVFSRSDALGLAVGDPGPAEEQHYTNGQLSTGYHKIQQVYVDNAFDTQRRRGLKPTARTFGS